MASGSLGYWELLCIPQRRNLRTFGSNHITRRSQTRHSHQSISGALVEVIFDWSRLINIQDIYDQKNIYFFNDVLHNAVSL